MTTHRMTLEQRLLTTLNRIALAVGTEVPNASQLSERACENWTARLRPNSIRSIESDLRLWIDWWSASLASSPPLDAQTIVIYIRSLEDRALSRQSIIRAAASLKMVLEIFGWPDPTARSVVAQVQHSSQLESGRDWTREPAAKAFGWTQVQKCLATAIPTNPVDTRNMAILLVLYDTLARPAQLLGEKTLGKWYVSPLRPEAISHQTDGAGTIHINGPQGGPSERCYLSPLTMIWIKRHQALSPSGQYLFPSLRGAPCSAVLWLATMQPLLRRLGPGAPRFGLASLRLGAATDMLRAGTSLDDVRQSARWAQFNPVLRLIRAPSLQQPTRQLAELQGRIAIAPSEIQRRASRTPKSKRTSTVGQRYLSTMTPAPGVWVTGDLFTDCQHALPTGSVGRVARR
jgi:integrase